MKEVAEGNAFFSAVLFPSAFILLAFSHFGKSREINTVRGKNQKRKKLKKGGNYVLPSDASEHRGHSK